MKRRAVRAVTGLLCAALLLAKSGSRLVSSCAVNAHFTGFAAHSIIYLSSFKSVVFEKFGVVNGVVVIQFMNQVRL